MLTPSQESIDTPKFKILENTLAYTERDRVARAAGGLLEPDSDCGELDGRHCNADEHARSERWGSTGVCRGNETNSRDLRRTAGTQVLPVRRSG